MKKIKNTFAEGIWKHFFHFRSVRSKWKMNFCDKCLQWLLHWNLKKNNFATKNCSPYLLSVPHTSIWRPKEQFHFPPGRIRHPLIKFVIDPRETLSSAQIFSFASLFSTALPPGFEVSGSNRFWEVQKAISEIKLPSSIKECVYCS